jgi:hypothetical protein
MVPEAGLEPARLAAQVFETCASADSATPARRPRPDCEGRTLSPETAPDKTEQAGSPPFWLGR